MATVGAAKHEWRPIVGDRTHETERKYDGKHVPHDSALSVGMVHDPENAKVQELQDEVKTLQERVAGDSQRFADYENNIRVLQAQLRQEKRKNENSPSIPATDPPNASPRPQPPGISRFGSFMHSRKPVPSPGREKELETQLVQEQTQRIAAEQKIKEVNGEIEELSTTLFQQANDMVSVERRENAALKERIKILEENETKTMRRLEGLEQRDTERKKRLDKIESALKRIERARALLIPR